MSFDLEVSGNLDRARVAHGAWVQIAPGARIRVRLWGTPAHDRARARAAKEREGRQLVIGGAHTLDEQKRDRVEFRACAHHILADWEGLEISGRTVGDHNARKALRLLRNYPVFMARVEKEAKDVLNFM